MTSKKYPLVSPLYFSLLLFLIAPLFTVAQQNADSQLIVVEISALDAYSYGDFARAMKSETDYTIKEACVPVGLVAFEVQPASALTREQAYQRIKAEITSSTGLSDITLTDHDFEWMRERCLNARRGGNNQQ